MYETVYIQLEGINSVIYSLKQSQVQHLLTTHGHGLFLQHFDNVTQHFSHCDTTKWSHRICRSYMYNVRKNYPCVPNMQLNVWHYLCENHPSDVSLAPLY